MGKPDKGANKDGEPEPWVHRGGLHAELRVRVPLYCSESESSIASK